MVKKKKKKLKLNPLHNKLKPLFSKYIRLRDAITTTGGRDFAQCCTCGTAYPIFGVGCIQAGHFVSGRKKAYLYEENGCHAQCYHCNVHLKGASVPYRRFMIAKYGPEETERQEMLFYQTRKFTVAELLEMIELYKNKIAELENSIS